MAKEIKRLYDEWAKLRVKGVPNFLCLQSKNVIDDLTKFDIPVFYHRLGSIRVLDSRGKKLRWWRTLMSMARINRFGISLEKNNLLCCAAKQPRALRAVIKATRSRRACRAQQGVCARANDGYGRLRCSQDKLGRETQARLIAMSILDDIRARLLPVDANGALTVKSAELDVSEVTSFFSEGLSVEAVTFTGASEEKAEDVVTIAGVATLFGYPGLATRLTFRMQDNASCWSCCRARFPSPTTRFDCRCWTGLVLRS